jgi:hydrogenase maturation protease
MDRVAVLALGSVLMGDDAAGPHVLRHLEAEHELPPEVELLDLGTPGPELAHLIEGLGALIVVDTARSRDGAPGEVLQLRRDEILRGPAPERLSPHDPSLRGALAAAELFGAAPREVLLVGIVPAEVSLGLSLSPAVEAALPRALEAVAAELERLGVPCPRRSVSRSTRAWWDATSLTGLLAPEPSRAGRPPAA